MIDPKSLRIGNKIHANVAYGGEIKTFKRFNDDLSVIFFSDGSIHGIGEFVQDCSGIPLSPSLLERAGFENIKELTFENSINPYWVKDAICLLYNETDPRNIFLPAIGFAFDGKYYVGHDGHWIEYFHELQNFYREHKHKELELNT